MAEETDSRLSFKDNLHEFPGDPVAKTLSSQCRGPGFDPWSENWIPHATAKSLHTATKDPVCCSEDPAQPDQSINQ